MICACKIAIELRVISRNQCFKRHTSYNLTNGVTMLVQELPYKSNKSKYVCDQCNTERVSTLLFDKGYKICSSCQRKNKVDKRVHNELNQVKALGYTILSHVYNRSRGTIECTVQCVDCKRVKSSTTYRLLKSNGTCVCKQLILDNEEHLMLSSFTYILGDDLKVSGIYQIVIGDDFYIGSSRNIKERLKGHFNQIKRGKHTSHMIRAVLQYGVSSISYKVLEQVEGTEEQLRQKEQEYIDKLQPTLNMLQDARVCRKLNTTTNKDMMVKIMMELINTRDLAYVSSKYNMSYNTIAGFSSGKTYTELKDEYPLEYSRAVIPGARLAYNTIKDVLCYVIQGKTMDMISKETNVERSHISNIIGCKNNYMKELASNDSVIGKLYDIIEIQRTERNV